jgi:hypothetical protein
MASSTYIPSFFICCCPFSSSIESGIWYRFHVIVYFFNCACEKFFVRFYTTSVEMIMGVLLDLSRAVNSNVARFASSRKGIKTPVLRFSSCTRSRIFALFVYPILQTPGCEVFDKQYTNPFGPVASFFIDGLCSSMARLMRL